MHKIVNIFFIFISLLTGHFLLIKPEISIILGFFLVILIIKQKDKRVIIINLIIFLLSLIRTFLLKSSIFTNYAIVIHSKENYLLVYNGLSKFYVYNQENTYNLFDIIYLDGLVSEYSFTNYESQFDFNEYLKKQLVFKEISLSRSYCIFKFPINMKKIYLNYIGRLDEEGKIVISKLLFNKDYSDEYNNFINNNSLFYLLSISSLHIYPFFSIIKSLLETKISSKNANKITMIINLIILIICNYKVGVFRILIQSIINYINEVKKLQINYLERVCWCLSILVIIDPSYCFSDSILYHIAIPCFTVFSRDAISTFKKKNQNIIKAILFYFLINIISIFLNDNFSILSFLLLPLLSFSIVLLFSLALIMFILPIEAIVSMFSKGLMFLLKPIFKLNSKIYMDGNILFIIIVILLFVLLLISIENKRKKYQKSISLTLIFYLIIINLPIKNQFVSSVYFINVGQGDSTLIVDRGVNILIDTGGVKNNNIAEETLIPFLKKRNIYDLDYVFLTHQDYDHVGAFETLKSNFKILNYNINNDFTTLKVGGITFYNLNPSVYNKENDDSLVLYFTMNSVSYLMMGDVSKEVEKEILKKYRELDVDILKVGHHGSNTSTSEELLKIYNPKIGIISCGKNNYYNHPSKEVLLRLEKYNVEIRRTDIEGTIKL